MAAPVIGKNIAIKVSNGTNGETVTVVNLSRNSPPLKGQIDSGLTVVLNTANTGVAWLSGDTIQVQISGRINDAKEFTFAGKGISTTLSGSADTTTPGVDL